MLFYNKIIFHFLKCSALYETWLRKNGKYVVALYSKTGHFLMVVSYTDSCCLLSVPTASLWHTHRRYRINREPKQKVSHLHSIFQYLSQDRPFSVKIHKRLEVECVAFFTRPLCYYKWLWADASFNNFLNFYLYAFKPHKSLMHDE